MAKVATFGAVVDTFTSSDFKAAMPAERLWVLSRLDDSVSA
ncbi:hypothetical protein [Thiorhodococcus mannitoliphagus]|nr:hypothetical protein [Thiorhodococcus mannitoliphagus]